MKFGIAIPDTYDEAVEIDIINGNEYWQDATKNEMKICQSHFQNF